jgi:hypothetical protein
MAEFFATCNNWQRGWDDGRFVYDEFDWIGRGGRCTSFPFAFLFRNMTDCLKAWRIYDRFWIFSFVLLSAKYSGRLRAGWRRQEEEPRSDCRPLCWTGFARREIEW